MATTDKPTHPIKRTVIADTAAQHALADYAAGRGWTCSCYPCRLARASVSELEIVNRYVLERKQS